MPTHIIVTIPASTANLGPGFDCLGLALSLRNTVEMTLLDSHETTISIEGEGAKQLKRDESNLIVQAAHTLWESIGKPPPAVKIRSINRIPLGSGLGSSSAAVVGGLAAANALSGAPLSMHELLRLAYQIEGHADNAAAALFGGLSIISADGSDVLHTSVELPPFDVVIALPNIQLSTIEARRALPAQVALEDAVFNIGHSLLVVQALQSNDYTMLGQVMKDRLHQPHRSKLIPGFDAAERAAYQSGAVAVALSGAGPSLAAFALERQSHIASAMKEAFENHGVACRTFVLPIDSQGTQVDVKDA